jgi:hypothetical protein
MNYNFNINIYIAVITVRERIQKKEKLEEMEIRALVKKINMKKETEKQHRQTSIECR